MPIRAVSRALAILQLINRHGSSSIMDLKEASGLAYPTVYRMVMTLVHEGLIEADAQKRYRPTELVWSLVTGFQTDDRLVALAKPYLAEFTEAHLWPVAISVRVGTRMMVKATTSSMTTQTFINYHPGYTLPLLECAAGKAYLAFCSPEERKVIQNSIDQFGDDEAGWGAELARNDFFLAKVREDGFASHVRNIHNETPGKTSAISVPVLLDDIAHATLTMVYFEKAMSTAEAAARYADALKRTARRIAADMASRRPRGP